MTEPRNIRQRTIYLHIETSLAPGRDMLKGVARYARLKPDWRLIHRPGSLDELSSRWRDSSLAVDGVITRIHHPDIAHAATEARKAGIAVVDILGDVPAELVPIVHCDDSAISKLAINHLLDRGFRNFAYCGLCGTGWSDRRGESTRAALQHEGLSLHTYDLGEVSNQNAEQLGHWLRQLPLPLGIFIACDHRAAEIFDACREIGLIVPDQAAIISVNNDEVYCNVVAPTLTSIDAAHEEIGFAAAQLMDRMMHNKDVAPESIYLPPKDVVLRDSTDLKAVTDPQMARAAHYVRTFACSGLQVGDVATHLNISRRALERRYREAFDSSIKRDVRNHQVERAKSLLSESALTIAEIAEMTGHHYTQHFCKIFKSAVGTTPLQYRKQISYRPEQHAILADAT